MTARRIKAHISRSHRRLLALLVVAVAAVPVVDAANRAQLHVDGDVVEVLTFESTVGELLEEQGVELAAGDEVLPGPATPLDETGSITILRTIDVTLVVDGEEQPMRGTWRTVEGLLTDAGVQVADDQVLRPGSRALLHDGDVVTVTSPRTVEVVDGERSRTVSTHLETVGELLDSLAIELGDDQRVMPAPEAAVTADATVTIETAPRVVVVADGERTRTRTFAPTVGDVLDEVGVVVGESDLVNRPLSEPIEGRTRIVVRRVTFAEVTEEVTLPYGEQRRPTSDLYEDETRVARSGVEGLRIDTYEVRLVDGKRRSRTLVGSEVVEEPVDRVVEVGTKARPAPASASGSGVWYDLARCESGLRWSYNGSSGYDGGLQFHPDTWTRTKPAGYPAYAWQATPEQQITVGKILQSRAGWGQWPACSAKLGLR